MAAIKLALEYNRDHRDSIHFTKMPRGFKIIGIRGWRYTNGGQMLHLNDFLIWKPPPGWLSVKELARRLEPQGANASLNSSRRMEEVKRRKPLPEEGRREARLGRKAFASYKLSPQSKAVPAS